MNQLQLYITTTAGGYSRKLEINPADEVMKYVDDITEALESVTYMPKEKHVFYLLKYIEAGVFVVIIRTIPDRPSEHLAAWVFIPAEIDIRGNDLTGIVDGVKRLVTNSRITGEDLALLRQLFSKTYPETAEYAAIVENYGNQYAHRFYGADTGYRITDLIGNMRYQTSYLPYAGVILANKDDVDGIEGADLTHCPLRRMVPMLPPEGEYQPYAPVIFSMPFDRPYLVPLSEDVEIYWECLGKDTIVSLVTVTSPGMTPPNVNTPATVEPTPAEEPVNAEEETLPADSPAETADDSAAAETTTPAGDKEEEWKLPEPAYMPELPEKFAAAGGTTSKPETDIPATDKPATDKPATDKPATDSPATDKPATDKPATDNSDVEKTAPVATAVKTQEQQAPKGDEKPASERERLYVFEMPSNTAATGIIRFEIHTKKPLADSPVEGYVLSDILLEGAARTNHLVYVNTDTRRTNLIWGACGVIAGILLSLIVSWLFSGADIKDVANDLAAMSPTDTVATTAAAQEAATSLPEYSLDDAIKYLDSTKAWNRTTMEQYPALQGLFDDMNNLELQKLVDNWGPKLSASSNFTDVVRFSRQSIQGKKLKRYNITPPYNKNPKDSVINIKAYANKIDR